MATFDITKKGLLLELDKVINTGQRGMINTEMIFVLNKSCFPNSWQDFAALSKNWAKIIDRIVKYSPKPHLEFIVAIDIPLFILNDKPLSFNWKKYEDPEIMLNCGILNTWLCGYTTNDANKITQSIDLVLPSKFYNQNDDFCLQLKEYKQIDPKGPLSSSVQYFIPLGQVIELKFSMG